MPQNKGPQDKVRVIRLLVYTGPRNRVEQQIENSIQHFRTIRRAGEEPMTIQAFDLDRFPQVLQEGIPEPEGEEG